MTRGGRVTNPARAGGDTPPTPSPSSAAPPTPTCKQTPWGTAVLCEAARWRHGAVLRAGPEPGRCLRAPKKGDVRCFSSRVLLASPSLRRSMGPAPRTLELFYDVLSPYSWLGFEVTPGAEGAGRGKRERRTQDLWSRAIPGSAQSGLGQADRQPGLKVTLYF